MTKKNSFPDDSLFSSDLQRGKDDLLKNLNDEQLEAVKHKEGPLLIIAGAGTGKTSVITRKIAYIIAQKWAKPSEILALTFTDKAAGEMEERVDQLVPYGFVDTQISTFHAFGDRLLRDFAIDLGLPANFKILSATEQAIFMRENLYAFDLKYYRPISNPLSHIDELLKHFSRLKDELISPDEYLGWAENQKSPARNASSVADAGGETGNQNDAEEQEEQDKQLELAHAYQTYQDLMLQAGNLDYGDQIFLAYKLLKENKKILKDCQKRFKYILVDEFQDTNFAQYQIVRLLSDANKNVTVVGDDDQSIYRFRGASISNILSFKDDYLSCKQIVLNKNYRSTQEILDASYKLIKHNNPDRLEVQNKINKKLTALKKGELPELLYADTLSCEADQVVAKIIDLKKQKNLKYNDFAILSRANNHLEPFIQALNYKNVPNIFVGASSLFSQPEIRMLVAFLKTLAYDDDNLSFYQLATSELYNIDSNILAKYYSKIKRENKSFYELFDDINIAHKKIDEILVDIKVYRENISKDRAGEVLYEYLKEKQYFKKLMAQNSIESEIKITNIAKFFDRIAQFDHSANDKSVLAFLESLELILSVGDEVQTSDIDPDIEAVNLMSVHASKGLEWPVVFVVNMVADRFPSRDRREKIPVPDELIKEKLPEGDFHLQEERRLFYVGATRAKQNLFFSAADDYGGKRSKKLSQFILEIMDQPDVAKLKKKLSPLEKIERHAKTETTIVSATKKPVDDNLAIRLSRQQIDDYYTCPKKYYFASVIKIPLPTNWHFMYGTAIHEAIGRYFARKIRGERPSFDSVVEDFNQCFTSEGFITRSHEEERKRAGLVTLRRFFEDDQRIDLRPSQIEESFEFHENSVKIAGRYDLVLKNNDQSEIYDFKTSDVKDQKDADRRIRESMQMKMYALAWAEKYNQIPKTTLVFIESDIKGSRIFTEEDLEKTKEIILNVAQNIKRQNFKSKPDKRQCSLCPYSDICQDSAA
jgi:DNA helicase-2/ATP-dependent DNA helicase PcrA